MQLNILVEMCKSFFFLLSVDFSQVCRIKVRSKNNQNRAGEFGRNSIGQESENNKWKHSNFNRLHSFFHKNVFFFLKRLKEIEIASNKITTTFLILGHFEALMFF